MSEKKVAFITGGSRGIGAAIVRRLARDGFHVVAVARNADKLAEVVAQIKDAGGSAEPVACDISDSHALAAAIEKTIDTHGRLDVLVNNAGITKDGLLLRMEDADFDDVISTNLKSAFVAIRSAARAMMRTKAGRIINISSVSGVAGNAGQANYAASKAGLIGLSKSVAKELAAKNITCNVVAPGFIDTDMTQVLPDQIKQKVQELIPLRRFGHADEI
ncbi:MAG TPA: SDR family NAD(P)-dependent oxidoreductase, partial [Tepidisphaeraceae bacterium]|nr:SDR family NAD(P)-dependent oxidoreductase [Tepidisphaeraceae bacterium]